MRNNITETYCPENVLTLLEYSSQIGEAFRPLLGTRVARMTYFVAASFVVAETAGKYAEVRERQRRDVDKVLLTLADMALWRLMASVVFPGVVIRSVCSLTCRRLARSKILPVFVQSALTTCAGLSLIPLIVRPIDSLADAVLDHTLRKPVKT
ncbi:hypothetical protein PPYR_03561 [Photinus pyralis]|uniref:Mitochondrial fission process protein 1 n=1 Tax=Photinus pyralis TaxID=7054 RepID=A0A1Y1MH14_PHOPY|nr:mitochondrial fission process protein 1-like [Photinus pyralis]KAB0791761.1 hypothetical protein PPYR_03561 [Photinus pyralis]